MSGRRAPHQESIDLGEEEKGSPIYPAARDLPTSPCPSCDAQVILVHDSIAGGEAAAESAGVVFLVIGERTDGKPLVARPSNGLVRHECRRAS